MKQLQESELERELPGVIDAAERGERTVVVRDGKPIAVVTPFTASVSCSSGRSAPAEAT